MQSSAHPPPQPLQESVLKRRGTSSDQHMNTEQKCARYPVTSGLKAKVPCGAGHGNTQTGCRPATGIGCSRQASDSRTFILHTEPADPSTHPSTQPLPHGTPGPAQQTTASAHFLVRPMHKASLWYSQAPWKGFLDATSPAALKTLCT